MVVRAPEKVSKVYKGVCSCQSTPENAGKVQCTYCNMELGEIRQMRANLQQHCLVHLHRTWRWSFREPTAKLTHLTSFSCSSLSVIMLDIFQTGVTSIRWQKWFMESRQSLKLVRYTGVWTTTWALLATNQPVPFPIFNRHTQHTHTHTPHTSLCAAGVIFLELVKQNKLVDLTNCWLYFQ